MSLRDRDVYVDDFLDQISDPQERLSILERYPQIESGSSIPDINVLDYGATGDGETDDLAAINSAAVAAQSVNSSTSFVYFPAGTYMVSDTVDIRHPLCRTRKGWGSLVADGLRPLPD